ncbi:hypothetical protein POMI540_3187 [Schizosaccharomyces pombe]|uniref:Conserved oligomeric Golgi complex subunit 2 n=1 Tax=Schizosaccharomyces pombe (strain 972 / ATCC 24843) TaxID=284812 RepID=COG2_SCHPO|nr:putative COG complex subunit Cog2 [Schizosaccharomyces pombe]O59705.2 RecName: Full=Conserved oligomeric Golgi complex subunit 2; Short=COG complex subunit 2; AltName: Full=Component of oligomeric Golgi complex 2 [Schizosaccharomyces pombe 972h-]CAA19056.2 Golgi transport complex subunit Cog2 (predicted) [Schizosaccharomyces pombe]|eukprot:NP_595336.1 putative COG complex subunit Cog2 [Schizosaccharomyces pombe]
MTEKDADSGSDLVDAFLSDAYLNTEELRKDGPFSPDEFLVSKRFLGLDGLVNELSRLFEQVNNELMLLVKDNYQDFVHLGSRMKSGNTKVSTLISSIHRSEEQLKNSKQSLIGHSTEIQNNLKHKQDVENEKLIASNLLLLDQILKFLKSNDSSHPLWLESLNNAQRLCDTYKDHPWVQSISPTLINYIKH